MNIEVYTRPGCTYCDAVKQLLRTKGLVFQEFNASKTNIKATLLEKVANAGFPAPRTVPQVLIDDEYIGGYEELASWMHKFDLSGGM